MRPPRPPSALAVLALALTLLPVWCLEAAGPRHSSPRILKVLLSSYAAELQLDGRKLDKPGFERIFKIPEEIVLPAGADALELTVTLKPNNYETITRTRRVSIAGGADIIADLREEDPHRPDRIFIRYLSTPLEIVNAMLKLAGVGPKDTVYDLGCGDGRLVIDAVEWYGAKRAVGIDIDPARIKESRENARNEGVENKVEFRRADVLDIKDLSDADVVLLFLGQDLNLALRPVLQKTLKPGSRVVSSYFTMGIWKPDRTENVRADDRTVYPLHLWLIK
jgi:precorrin-6B methylase 2